MSNIQHLLLNPAASSTQCLTGRVYQLVQTTEQQGGKNVLQLIPVSKSTDNVIPLIQAPARHSTSPRNVQTQLAFALPSQIQNVTLPLSIQNLTVPSPVQVQVLKQPGLGNYIITNPNNLSKSPDTIHVDNKPSPLQSRTVILEKSLTSFATSPQPEKPAFMMMNPNTQSIAVKSSSPMLPSGHHLQIPANAEVKSVPASLLPFAIQQKILAATNCNDHSKNPSVIYVSPVNTVRTVTKQQAPVPHKVSTSSVFPAVVASTAVQTTGDRKPSGGTESPEAPMKWVVQENKESAACLVPVKSSNDTASKILKMFSGTKNEEANLANVLPMCNNSVPSNSKVIHIKDNALVMYNNKIYLLAKRGSEVFNAETKPASTEKSSSPTESVKDISNKVVEVVLSKKKGTIQSNNIAQSSPNSDTMAPLNNRLETLLLPFTQDVGPNSDSNIFCLNKNLGAQTHGVLSKMQNEGNGVSLLKTQHPISVTTTPQKPAIPTVKDVNQKDFCVLRYNKVRVDKSPAVISEKRDQVYGGHPLKKQSPILVTNTTKDVNQKEFCVLGYNKIRVAKSPAVISEKRDQVYGGHPLKTQSPIIVTNTTKVQVRSSDIVRSNPSFSNNKGTDEHVRLKFGLIKKEKVILRRLPLFHHTKPEKRPVYKRRPTVNGNMTAETNTQAPDEKHQIKRKWSLDSLNGGKRRNLSDSGLLEDTEPVTWSKISPSSSQQENSMIPADSVFSSTIPSSHERSESPLPPPCYSEEDFSSTSVTYSDPPTEVLPSTRVCTSPVDLDDTVRDEKIRRLKEILKERELALEAIRNQWKP
ncbi:ligand-dependent nuclear receptor-interacting factor 1 [Pelodytes ibericus]